MDFVVGNAELGARAVCSILLGMNILGAKSVYLISFFSFHQSGAMYWLQRQLFTLKFFFFYLSLVGSGVLGAKGIFCISL